MASTGRMFSILEYQEGEEMHDYFYGSQSDQFTFYRIPTVLFSDEQYKDLSVEAKLLYGILLKRMELSAKNGWFDEKGRVYIIFPLNEIMEKLNCADNKATKMMDELENGVGLIERKRQGLGKPNLIFVKNFIDSGEESLNSRFLNRENRDSGILRMTNQDSLKSRTSNTNDSYTEKSDTDLIYLGSDAMRDRVAAEEYFKGAMGYDSLVKDYPNEKKTVDGIVDLLADVCTTNRETLRVSGEDRPSDMVRARLMRIDASCIRYVLLCLKENCSDVKSIRQYLLSVLYNAPVTIAPYYQSRVNHDLGALRIGEGKSL